MGQRKELLHIKGWQICHSQNCEQQVTISTVKSILKIPPQHNGVVPIKITGPAIKEHMMHSFTDDNSTKGRDPNIIITNNIHKIIGKKSVNILVSNYTNKHVTFNTGEYIGHLEPATTDDTTTDDSKSHSTNSIPLQKMMAEQVQLDIFDLPQHKLKPGIQSRLDTLLKEYETQFAKDETAIGTTLLTEMTINTGNSEPVSKKPYPIAVENYQWVKNKSEKLHAAKVICSSRSSWSAPIIVVPKGDRGK